MLTLKSLRERMRKANPKAKCSIDFCDYSDDVRLKWSGDNWAYSLSFSLYELSVTNKNFQREMFNAEKEMAK